MIRRFTLVSFIAFAACATVGKKFDTTHVHDVQKGVQSKAEIQAWFGPAGTTSMIAKSDLGCTERWMWQYAHSVAGGSTTSEALVVDFDAQGKVCDSAYSKQ
jgi:hypothetical protein